MSAKANSLTPVVIPQERIEQHIYLFRGKKVMLSDDLAALYAVPVRQLILRPARNDTLYACIGHGCVMGDIWDDGLGAIASHNAKR